MTKTIYLVFSIPFGHICLKNEIKSVHYISLPTSVSHDRAHEHVKSFSQAEVLSNFTYYKKYKIETIKVNK